jgi:hypothetical protein
MPFGPTPSPDSRRMIDKYVWRLTALCVVLILACGGLIFSLIAVSNANTATRRAQAACQLYKSVAESTVTPQTTVTGLTLLAGARVAYYNAACHLGPLRPPDQRVRPLLPAGLR